MSDQSSICEQCRIEFESTGEVTSSRVLCPACAAHRRAALRAAKAGAGTARPGPTTAVASTRAKTAQDPKADVEDREDEVPRRRRSEAHPVIDHEEVKRRKEAAQKRIVKIGWSVVGGLALLTGGVVLYAMNKQESRRADIAAYQKSLDDFRDGLLRVNLDSEDQLQKARDEVAKERKLWRFSRIEGDVASQLTKINSALQTINKTRGLVEQLAGIEAQLARNPELEGLGQLFVTVRNPELSLQAVDAGGPLKTRYDQAVSGTVRKYVDALRTAANGAAQATTGEALAPFGTLEDTLRVVLESAMAVNDVETQTTYRPLYTQVVGEINQITVKVFDEAYQNRVPAKDLLVDIPGWTLVPSSSFSHKFGAGLTLTNTAGEDAASGGLSYTPADGWRDYVLDIELKLDSGMLVFYTRIEDRMDAKMVPAFTVGTQNPTKTPNVLVEYGKPCALVVRVIGRQLSVTFDGAPVYSDDISGSKSRKGEPGVVAQAGTIATINRFRARHLR